MKTLFAAAAAFACALVPMAVRADDDILKHLINNPNSASWIAYGSQTSKKIADPAVQGGQAFEVTVTQAGPQPYSTAAQQDVTGPIRKGDKLIIALWLKAATADNAPSNLHVRMQLNAAPYTGITEGDVSVGGAWKMYSVQGVADADHPKGTAALAIHIGNAKQVIDLGPAFVLDMGPDTAAQ